MTDYKKATGSSGTMMIRDNGTSVSFMINSGNSSTFANDMPWGYTINGGTNNNRESRYSAGAGWVTLGTWTVTTDQTVTFRLFDTNTSGLGGPTTLSADIDRAKPPNAPTKPTISSITGTSMRVKWISGNNNGSSHNLYQVARNTVNSVSSANITTVGSDRDDTFTGLAPRTTYYFWARTRNDKGYSPWSPVAYAKTLGVGDAPDQVITSDPSQTGFTASFTDNYNGGSAVLERQLLYNTSNTTAGATTVNYVGVMTLTGLEPATTYYVWGRVRNSSGWSPYSPVATERTIAGAWYNVDGEWKEAIPYVKDGGLWKLARPWGRVAGVWKESS
jgi:hypothetical protein